MIWDCMGGPTVIPRILQEEAGESVRERSDGSSGHRENIFKDTLLMVLKTEEGARNQRMQAALNIRKGKRIDPPQEPLRKTLLCQQFDFSPMKQFHTADCQN